MIIERPYDELKAVKIKMREMLRNLADLEVIVSNMQDHLVCDLENTVDDLQLKLDGQYKAKELEKIIFSKEK